MSLIERRNAALKSSISINSIRNSANNFLKGINRSQKEASEINEQTKKNNLFKKSLIRNDNSFFSKRRENVLRKEREDEIEASTLQGSTKRQGNIIQRSTKGFLGRILDIVGIVIIGWFTTKLLPILPKLSGLITLMIKLLSVGKKFTDVISTFIVEIEEGITKQFTKIPKKPELEQIQTEAVNGLEETNNKVQRLNLDFFRLAFIARDPRNFGRQSFSDTASVYSEAPQDSEAFLPDGTYVGEDGGLVLPKPEEREDDVNEENNDDQKQNDADKIDGIKQNDSQKIENQNVKDREQLIEEEKRKRLQEENKELNQKESIEEEGLSDADLIKGLENANKQYVSFFKDSLGYDTERNMEIESSTEKNIKDIFKTLRRGVAGSESLDLKDDETMSDPNQFLDFDFKDDTRLGDVGTAGLIPSNAASFLDVVNKNQNIDLSVERPGNTFVVTSGKGRFIDSKVNSSSNDSSSQMTIIKGKNNIFKKISSFKFEW